MDEQVHNKINVSCGIDKLKVTNPELSYLEACLQYADNIDIDRQDIHLYINDTLYQKIEEEAGRLNMLKVKPSSSNLSEWI
tara:strand:- start:2723 stop:2965 length:243 start_codon:yes stop_codon:yes gene_type:complete